MLPIAPPRPPKGELILYNVALRFSHKWRIENETTRDRQMESFICGKIIYFVSFSDYPALSQSKL